MIIPKNLLIEAKAKLGTDAAIQIAEDLKLEKWDEKSLKGCCPFHGEDSPSFLWNPKDNCFKCFGCGINYGILDHYTKYNHLSFIDGVIKLFEKTKTQFAFGERGVKQHKDYKYPKREYNEDRTTTEEYLAFRKLSPETLDYLDIQEDSRGNMVFHFYDSNDVLTTVKYRPSRKLSKEENKTWCQPGADSKSILYNMNRIDPTKPLVISEGELDTGSIIEAGYKNSVSVPFGAGNFQWIEENWEWLEQFDQIICWSDNDEPGIKMRKEVCSRLGNWRCKYVDVPKDMQLSDGTSVNCKDANGVLFYFGENRVLDFINNAQELPIVGVSDLSSIDDFDIEKAPGLYTHISAIDNIVYKFLFGSVALVTGTRGCVDKDTEFFNGKQWKKISDYEIGDKVLQYNQDRTASLVEPLEYHKYPEEYLWHFKTTKGLDQCLSDEHNMVYITSKGNLGKKSFLQMRDSYINNGFPVNLPACFDYGSSGIDYDENTIRLFVASICDGSYYYHIKNENAISYTRCRFHLKKEVKKQRIESLLKNSNYSWRKIESANIGYTDFYVDLPIRIKEFDEWWYNCSHNQLEVICDEVLHWDGYISERSTSFFTTIKKNADFIQFAFSSCGKLASINTSDRRGRKRIVNGKEYTTKSIDYKVTISKARKVYSFNGDFDKQERENFFHKYKTIDGYKYCFSVPSEMLILRRNDSIFVTGNSGKSTFLNQIFVAESLDQGYDTFIFSGELAPPVLKSWIELTLAGREKVTMKDRFVHIIDPDAKKQMRDWYKERIWVYDQESNRIDDVLDRAISITRKYGAKTWILDNLMVLDLDANDNNVYEKQKELLSKLLRLANLYGVFIVLVTHPKKLQSGFELGADDISGSNSMSNLAQYIISVKRYSDKEKSGEKDGKGNYRKGKEPIEFDVAVDILKNRFTGKVGRADLYFDYWAYRFYQTVSELFKRFGWNKDQSPLPKTDPNKHRDEPDWIKD